MLLKHFEPISCKANTFILIYNVLHIYHSFDAILNWPCDQDFMACLVDLRRCQWNFREILRWHGFFDLFYFSDCSIGFGGHFKRFPCVSIVSILFFHGSMGLSQPIKQSTHQPINPTSAAIARRPKRRRPRAPRAAPRRRCAPRWPRRRSR